MGARRRSKSRNGDFFVECHSAMLGEHSAPGVGSGGCIFGVRKRRGANPVAGLIAFSRAKRARLSAAKFGSGALDRLVLYVGNMEWSLFSVLNLISRG